MPGAIPVIEPLPAEGVLVPLRASFIGVKGVPVLSLGHNNLSPILRLYPDDVEFRVFRLRRRPYSAIGRIDVLTTLGTRNVEFVWKDSILTFAANVENEAWRLAVLGFLAKRGIPATDAAMRLLQGAGGRHGA